jgi:2-oxoglutarate decarboxylase
VTTQSEPTSFGMNEWLVYEKYQSYLANPDSVDPAWKDFFADYDPSDAAGAAPRSATSTRVPPPPENATPGGNGSGVPTGLPASPAPVATPATSPAPPAATPEARTKDVPHPSAAHLTPLRGASARVVANMEASLQVPTATSVRTFPAKLLADNRIVINRHLARARGGKVSFTHLLAYALVRAVRDVPVMNDAFAVSEGKPAVATPAHINLGLAIDLPRPDGGRSLVVANIKTAETMDFAAFWSAYEDVVRRARAGRLTTDDFAGTTISLTNPGGIGTVHSVPRLMSGQGTIVAVGAMEYPPAFQGASDERLAELGISRTITLTSTYDHRIIQGAQSGEFLRRMHELLLGEDGFYDAVFASLRVPYEPVRWIVDVPPAREGELGKEARVLELIHAYRVRGHLMADTDPLEFKMRTHPDLDIVNHGLTLWDLDRNFPTNGFAGQPRMLLRDILGVLRDSYCRTVGIEYMHISDPEERQWIQERVERPAVRPDPSTQLHVLERLNAAEAFESFLQTKYVGNKRFSLEGAESTIPVLDAILTGATKAGLDEVVVGMAHRGRLNVLANIVGKSYRQIFQEFEGNIDPRSAHGSGDVKYHLGAEGTFTASDGGTVAVSLVSNPSHLEAVDPVLEGVARAKQDILDKGESGFTVLPLLLHGDAAFAGQGVVAETLNLSQLRGYRTGGTVHLVVNNQLGFTTSPKNARSSVYATDVARMVQAPIFHVNGDDPEACVRVAQLAFDYRQAFRKDVVIDLVCYRRRGHSEVDEPSFTQPLMYRTIESKRSVRKIYMEALIGRGDLSLEEAEAALRNYQEQLEKVFQETQEVLQEPSTGSLPPVRLEESTLSPVAPAIGDNVVQRLVDSQVSLPEGFTPHPRLKTQLDKRATMVQTGTIDWAFGETLAFGSLLLDGHPVRLSGQDSRRGTFGQRHAVLIDNRTGEEWAPLKHLSDDQAAFYVYDSPLSEFAGVGFEYGYAVARPDALVCWEAQFGDFANGAQSIFDEFISAGEAKWGQRCGVALLLPHGYEGQGPDHSSARIERYLAMCAQGNMTVAAPSTPASYFHLLRRHILGAVVRPLVVFTPKSMLRLRAATSPVEEFTAGSFAPVLDDPAPAHPSAVRRIVLTSGKVYYDLAAAKAKRGAPDVAIVRLEQLYPLPAPDLAGVLARYEQAGDVVWVQEEPANMGAWPRLALELPAVITGTPGAGQLSVVSRPASASPASGSARVHEREQAELVEAALST